MASLMGLLLETMPFAAVAQAFKERGRNWEDLSASEAKERITLLANDSSFDVELPALNEDLDKEEQKLWAFSHGSEEPAAVRSVYCRVRDADYVGHRVANKICWGLEESPETYRPAVRITFRSGAKLMFPLSKDYVYWKFLLRGGNIADDQTRLWRLKAVLDTSLVVVFAYDIDPATGEVVPMSLDRIVDPKVRDDARKADSAVRRLLGSPSGGEGAEGGSGSGPGENLPPEPEPITPDDVSVALSKPEEAADGASPRADDPPEIQVPWGSETLKGDFWHCPSETGTAAAAPITNAPSGEVGSTVELATEPARVLIVFSFATCCERADFEAGGVVGFAKCLPHLLVSATVGVQKIEGSVRLDRPRELEKWPETGRDMAASCCKPGHDAWTPELRGLLIADANEKSNEPLVLPAWSNLFDYYLNDPHRVARGDRFHIIRTDRPFARESERPLVEREVIIGFDQQHIRKEPRQGEFDNLHLAPRLKLLHVASVTTADPIGALFDGFKRFKIEDRAEWALDEITMAPFCAHDCFHIHWRWGAFSDAKWVLGWGATGPYEKAGAPMVPQSQDVWLFFRADAAVTYHVVDQGPVFLAGFCPLMHHGLAYAVSIVSWMKVAAGIGAVSILGSRFTFKDESGMPVSGLESTAMFYWWARHNIEINSGQPFVYERLRWASDRDLTEAREL